MYSYKHINKAKKEPELGESIYVKNIYLRNDVKPFGEGKPRYSKQEIHKMCTYVGKRVINYNGFTACDDEYYFVPVVKWTVHLVAISKQRIAYVIDEDIL